jgi:hypothetical protein
MINEARHPGASPLAALRAAFDHVVEFFATFGDVVAFAREAERLTTLTDAELAKLGLKRDQIVDHLYRRHLA